MLGPACIEETDEGHYGSQQKTSQVQTHIWDTSPEDGKGSAGFGYNKWQ